MVGISRTRLWSERLEELRGVPNVIVDESFIHFACEGDDFAYGSVAERSGGSPT